MKTRAFDVVIVGGGVAGASLATVLARAALGVCVVEREAVFRDRVRGEGIHPWGVAEANRAGLAGVLEAAGAQALPLWQTYADRVPDEPRRWSDVSIDGLPEMGVHHPRLQEAAIAAARDAGVTVLRPAKATAFRASDAAEVDVSHKGSDETLRARLVVGADGRTSAARRWSGGTTEQDPEHHRFGGMLAAGVAVADDAAHESPIEGGRFFILPQGEGRARVYVVTHPERNRDVQADKHGERLLSLCAAHLPEGVLQGAEPVGPVAFFPNADRWASRIAGGRVVLVGDAAGANDPSVGHGLSLVFRDVRELAELLLDGDDWEVATREFAARRERYFEVLRQHASWVAMLVSDEGPEADARRARVERAREQDPSAGGFALIFARGPDGLVADEAARARFFGEVFS